jgi:flagellar basal-body rod protein FlgF
MDRLTHTALSAMRTLNQRQAQIAHNLANSTTPGFRGDVMRADARYVSGGTLSARAMATGGIAATDMGAGAITATGRPLDVAMTGETLLAVQTSDGNEGYTRRGDLLVGETGLLETGDGLLVLGDGGPLSIPPHDAIRIADDGGIHITPPGGGEEIALGRLRLASPAGSPLAKGLDGVLRVPGGGALPVDPDARVIPGSLEASNVTATEALVEMIAAARGFETQVRLLTTARELDETGTALMRLPS